MKILGLSFGYHDASAALVIDGKFVAGTHEERFTRKKHDNSFPINSVRYCLESASLDMAAIDSVVYYENPLLKFDRLLNASLLRNDTNFFDSVLNSFMSDASLDITGALAELFNIKRDRVTFLEHHLSHASAAFYPSPFQKAAVLTIDGLGEYETITISQGHSLDINKIESFILPDSLGLFYSAYTSFLGFEVNEGEYKVMGMASFGSPIYRDQIYETIFTDEDDRFHINHDFFDFIAPKSLLYTDNLVRLFGAPRKPDEPFFTEKHLFIAPGYMSKSEKKAKGASNQKYADIAASLQDVTEDIILGQVKRALKQVGCRNLCLSGGVALNSVANGKIRRLSDVDGIFIQPAAGDGGSALGAALYYAHAVAREPRNFLQKSCLVGKSYSVEEIEKSIIENCPEEILRIEDEENLFDAVSDLLIKKKVIGWFHGCSEWGPRALGGRSILADPRGFDMKLIVNERIKFREPFRPFAPSVLAEYASEWFDLPENIHRCDPENFMLTVVGVREDKKDMLQAVTHVDGSARVHVVWKDVNESYYKLIDAFYKKTGVPVLLNTSFNLKGEPIVQSPKDAIMTFGYSEMDYLVMPPFIIRSYWSD